MSKVINCPNCGQRNRVNESSDSSQAICAKCWTKLNVSKETAQPPPPLKIFTVGLNGNCFSFSLNLSQICLCSLCQPKHMVYLQHSLFFRPYHLLWQHRSINYSLCVYRKNCLLIYN